MPFFSDLSAVVGGAGGGMHHVYGRGGITYSFYCRKYPSIAESTEMICSYFFFFFLWGYIEMSFFLRFPQGTYIELNDETV